MAKVRLCVAAVALGCVILSAFGCASGETTGPERQLSQYPGIPIEREIREAAILREKAIVHYQMALRTRLRSDSILHFREAVQLFRAALDLYFDAVEKYPEYQKYFVEYEIETVDKYIRRCMQYCPASVSPLEEMYVETGPSEGLTPDERKMKIELEAKVTEGAGR